MAHPDERQYTEALALLERGVSRAEILKRFPQQRAALEAMFETAALLERTAERTIPSKRLLHGILTELQTDARAAPVPSRRLHLFHVERLAFLVTAVVLVVVAAGLLQPGARRGGVPSLSRGNANGAPNGLGLGPSAATEGKPDGNANTGPLNANGTGESPAATQPEAVAGSQNENRAAVAPDVPEEDLTELLALETAFSETLAADADDEASLAALDSTEALDAGLDAALAM